MRLLLALAVVAACGKAGDESKKMQDEAPPRVVDIPATVSIDVQVDGAAKPKVTADVLKATKPDYADTDRKAWRIATIIPEAGQGATIEASNAVGVTVKYPHQDGIEPVLYLTRRGEVAVAALDPKDPFPRFHGQGGRLHRPGDQLPHVMQVARIAITHGP